jgi:hypothetical protein
VVECTSPVAALMRYSIFMTTNSISSSFVSLLQYDCSSPVKCENDGPYFSGMSVASCDAHGGTWCPGKTDCEDLKDCIDLYSQEAVDENQMAFASYLKSAPNITTYTSMDECGRAREYFGFNSFFSNDKQICEDIAQLRFTRDFAFLDSFFGQGDSGSDGSGDEYDNDELPAISNQKIKGKQMINIELDPMTVPPMLFRQPDRSECRAPFMGICPFRIM